MKNLKKEIKDQVWDKTREQVFEQVCYPVKEYVWDQTCGTVCREVRWRVREQLKNNFR